MRQKVMYPIYLIVLTMLLCVLFSCEQKTSQIESRFTITDSIQAPVVITVGQPIITLLDTCAAPKKVTMASSPDFDHGDSTTSSRSLALPEVQSADFYINMERFDTDQGLALSSVLDGLKDSNGRLWFGTSGNGLNMYDGTSFKTYNSSHGLLHNLVRTIYEDSKGTLWIGTYGGLSKFDGATFENYSIANGLIDNEITSILEDSKGRIWLASYNGLTLFEGTKMSTIEITKDNQPLEVFDVMEDTNGHLLFATAVGVYFLDIDATGTTEIVPYMALDMYEGFAEMHLDKQGGFWLITEEGVYHHNSNLKKEQNETWDHYTTKDGLVHNNIHSVSEDSKGNLWFATVGGVSKYLPSNVKGNKGSFYNITSKQGLAMNDVRDITEDDNGTLWFSTYGAGLQKYDGNAVRSYTSDQGLKGMPIGAITSDDAGSLWLASFSGMLTKFDQKQFSNYNLQSGLGVEFISGLFIDDGGAMWVTTGSGVSKFEQNNIFQYTTQQGLLADYTISGFQDSSGNFWIGSYEAGITKFNGQTMTGYTTEQGLVHNTVWSSIEDSEGIIWFATRGGLSRFDGKTFTNFTKEQGLVEDKLSKILQDSQGNLIIGSWGSGVSIVRKEDIDQLAPENDPDKYTSPFISFTTSNGLSNDVVYDIEEDSKGNIFFGSSTGITVLRGGVDPTGNQIAKDGVENYNQATGYPIKDIANNHGMFMDKDDVLWAGTGDKLVRFDYSEIQKNTKPPTVFIQKVKINNEDLSWRLLEKARSTQLTPSKNNRSVEPFVADELMVFGKTLNNEERDSIVEKYKNIQFSAINTTNAIPNDLVLPYVYNNISFDFVGVETSRPSLVKYQFKLEGYDDDWNPVTTATSASFGNIPHGSHTFIVKALSPDGVWSEPIQYNFEVLAPWYRSWLAYVFYALLLVFLFWLIDRFQRSHILEKERQRSMQRELAQAKEIEKAYTNLKDAQKLLVQSEKMASLGELTAGIAHEIQNPLNFVNNFSELSNELIDEMNEELEKGDLEEVKFIAKDIKENLSKINHHGKRAEGIVKGMLQHSRKSTVEREPTDINKLADEYLRLAYHGLRAKDKSFNATLETDFDENLGLVNMIPQDMGRVILNLITNAFYACTEKAKTIEDTTFMPTVSVATKKLKDQITISVKDNGSGIPKEALDKIFQPFFTTKPVGEGTGLGLSMSYDIIKAHGGELKVETVASEGTTFKIILPS